MVNLRSQARDRDCQIRLDGCRHDPEYTVLAHFRMTGVSGLGFKSPDWLGSWSCDKCHLRVDTDKSPEVQLAFAKGCFRTQAILFREGALVIA